VLGTIREASWHETSSTYRVPSAVHEILVEIFRDNPELIVQLLGDQLEMVTRSGLVLEPDEPNLSQLIEIDSDLVFRVLGPERQLLCALIIEVQLAIDHDKGRAWAAYQAGTHRRLRCPTYVIVIAIDPVVARWATGPFCTGQTTFAPIVLGPEEVPVIGREVGDHATLPLTLLSGLAHANDPDILHIGETLWGLIDEAEPSHGHLYWDLFLNAINDATKKALLMQLQNYRPQSDWGKKFYAEGREDGLAQGRADGLAQGRADGEAEALALLLDARGLPLKAEQRARVEACSDRSELHAWLRRAATAESLADVFDDDPDP